MKKVMLAFVGTLMISSVYAINPPKPSDNNNVYSGVAFVNKSKSPTLAACPQKTLISVTKELVQKIANRDVNSSNANEIEQSLGPACSCIPANPFSIEVWTCQWKGELTSNRLENTINVTYEAGMLIGVTAMTTDGVVYTAEPNAKVKVLKAQ